MHLYYTFDHSYMYTHEVDVRAQLLINSSNAIIDFLIVVYQMLSNQKCIEMQNPRVW